MNLTPPGLWLLGGLLCTTSLLADDSPPPEKQFPVSPVLRPHSNYRFTRVPVPGKIPFANDTGSLIFEGKSLGRVFVDYDGNGVITDTERKKPIKQGEITIVKSNLGDYGFRVYNSTQGIVLSSITLGVAIDSATGTEYAIQDNNCNGSFADDELVTIRQKGFQDNEVPHVLSFPMHGKIVKYQYNKAQNTLDFIPQKFDTHEIKVEYDTNSNWVPYVVMHPRIDSPKMPSLMAIYQKGNEPLILEKGRVYSSRTSLILKKDPSVAIPLKVEQYKSYDTIDSISFATNIAFTAHVQKQKGSNKYKLTNYEFIQGKQRFQPKSAPPAIYLRKNGVEKKLTQTAFG